VFSRTVGLLTDDQGIQKIGFRVTGRCTKERTEAALAKGE
jgi:hypothetical protein